MNQFQQRLASHAMGWRRGHGAQSLKREGRPMANGLPEDPTTLLAEQVVEATTGITPDARSKERLGTAGHYLLSATLGVIYGLLVARWPVAARGAGLPFGLATWGALDQVAMPLAGLARPPQHYPLWLHGATLAAHLAFGGAVEVTRRTLARVGIG